MGNKNKKYKKEDSYKVFISNSKSRSFQKDLLQFQELFYNVKFATKFVINFINVLLHVNPENATISKL